MKASDISRTLAHTLFNYQRYICVENVSFGMLPWEADMLVCSQSGYLYEVEIKVSIADLKRDPFKSKWRMTGYWDNPLKGMWFAMPAKVWEHHAAPACVPKRCGVIVVDPEAKLRWARAQVVRSVTPVRGARPISDAERFQLARLGVMRYWCRKEPVDESTLKRAA